MCLPFGGAVPFRRLSLLHRTAYWGGGGVTNNDWPIRIKQAWRPGSIGAGGSDAATSSHPAPETVQMVTKHDGSHSARSGASSARSVAGAGAGVGAGAVGGDEKPHHHQRIPSMQLARVAKKKNTENGRNSTSNKPQGMDDDPEGGGGGCGTTGGGKTAEDGFSWMVAVAAPMPPLHGFCLAVVGLETGMVGAAVTLVDRSVAPGKEEAAVGFLGFEKVRYGGRRQRKTAAHMAGPFLHTWCICVYTYIPGIYIPFVHTWYICTRIYTWYTCNVFMVNTEKRYRPLHRTIELHFRGKQI